MPTLPVNSGVKPPEAEPAHISSGIAQWVASLDEESREKLASALNVNR